MTGERTPPGPGAPVVSLLTDYGVRDELVGVCHAVILGICPTARIVDVTHGVSRHAVRSAAVVLRNVIGYLPPGCTSWWWTPRWGPSAGPWPWRRQTGGSSSAPTTGS